jgi:hypothetical protein
MARSKVVRKVKAGTQPRRAPMEEMPSDDEVEKFHKSADKLSLRVSDDEEADSGGAASEEEDEAVFNLSDGGSDEDEDDSDAEGGRRLRHRALPVNQAAATVL